MLCLPLPACFGEIMLDFPFEFRALEVALEGVCSSLDAQTRELEIAAYPALDELTAKVVHSVDLLFVRLLSWWICRLLVLSIFIDMCRPTVGT